ncbi:hypothetical protein BsWGS_12426 [Bradybaena similaris]
MFKTGDSEVRIRTEDPSLMEQPKFVLTQVAFEHQPNKSTSLSTMEFPSHAPIGRLKEDIAHRVKVPPEFQKWFHKGKELNNDDTFHKLNLERDAIIFIKETKRSGLQEHGAPEVHKISKANSKSLVNNNGTFTETNMLN